jgi:hypothetical protein
VSWISAQDNPVSQGFLHPENAGIRFAGGDREAATQSSSQTIT